MVTYLLLRLDWDKRGMELPVEYYLKFFTLDALVKLLELLVVYVSFQKRGMI